MYSTKLKLRSSLSTIALASSLISSTAFAQFSPGPNPISGTVGNQTLSSGTGIVNSNGTVSTSGSTVAVTASGNSTITNNGTIRNTTSGRAIDSTTANSSITINNNGSITSGSSDAVRINNSNSSVFITNNGTISVAAGGQALDLAAIVTGTHSVVNNVGGIISAVGDDAIRLGINGTVNNSGNISATPTVSLGNATGSDGIDLRTERTGIVITNAGTISGRHGIATDGANVGPSSLTVNNNAGTISALNGSGLNVDGVSTTVTATVTNLAGATIRGGVLATATSGDGDGVDVDGVLTLTNSGDILGLGAKGANNPEAIAAGGGSITNNLGGNIIGSSLAGDAPNGDPTKIGSGILIDDSNLGNAISVATITNNGTIRGKTGFGIKIIGTFDDNITNGSTGIIQGTNNGGSLSVIQTGGGNDTVSNAGTITHELGNAHTAIATEDGNDIVNITGSSASITGGIDGGNGTDTLSIALGDPGYTFTYGGAISNFEAVNILSGTTTLTGNSSYSGTTNVSNSTLIFNGTNSGTGDMTISGNGTLGGDGSTAGSLFLASGAQLIFSTSETLTVNGSMVSFGGFGISDLFGLNGTVANGSYTLIDGSAAFSFTNVSNFGLANAFDIGGGKSAYFEAGSLVVTVVPEPSTVTLSFLAALLFAAIYQRRNAARA